jgi:hypothetical protein
MSIAASIPQSGQKVNIRVLLAMLLFGASRSGAGRGPGLALPANRIRERAKRVARNQRDPRVSGALMLVPCSG